MVSIAASIAVVGVSAAVDSSRRDARLQAVLDDLVRRRAEHLGMASPADACLFVRLLSDGQTLEFAERTDCTDGGSASQTQARTYDVRALSISTPGGATPASTFCVDNLTRVRDCAAEPVEYENVTISIDADRTSGVDGSITWTGSGRVTASFSSTVDASAQPHLSDLGSGSTPNPTRAGGYAGLATDPRGLLE